MTGGYKPAREVPSSRGGETASLAAIEGLIRARDKHAALERLTRAIRAEECPAGQWGKAVELARSLGDEELALEALDAWIAEAPRDPARRAERLEVLEGIGRIDAAMEEAGRLRDVTGGEAIGLFHQGVCQARRGARERSLASLREALAREPALTRAWDYIAAQKRFSAGDEDFLRLQSSYAKLQAGDPNQLAPVIHALGRAYDDMDHVERAFEKFTEAGELMRRYSPHDITAALRYAERLKETFSAEFFQRTRVAGYDTARPVFIVGPPRSGTTLLEQMLATHPALHAGGEHPLLRIATYPLGNFEAYELRDAFARNRLVFAECGQRYWQRVQERFGAHSRITDKTPVHHFFVGVIHLILPEARIVWMRRDLRDTAWSCFRTRIQGNRWTETIDDTVAWLMAYDGLMSHWKAAMGHRLHVVDYESLVEDPGGVMDRLHDFIGVERDQGWQGFHERGHTVSTASLEQVREPLHGRSIGAWRRYEKYLRKAYRALDDT